MIVIGNNPKWKVLKNNQLTDWQTYVYCKDERTANAVAERFRREPDSIKKYKWVDKAHAGKEHWCVTQALPWVIAHTSEVRHGQWYIGIWNSLGGVETEMLEIINGDAEVDDYHSGVGPIQDAGYVVVHPEQVECPQEVWCYRNQLSLGDAFVYLNEPDQPHVVGDNMRSEPQMPGAWLLSTRATAIEMKKWNARVKRIPRWDDKREPTILPCVDPLDRLLRTTANGLTGEQCLARFEEAMRCENVVRQKNTLGETSGFISTLGEGQVGVLGGIVGGLDEKQFELGQQCWSAKLARLQREAPIRERMKVVLDDQDELPNMAYVKDEADV